MTPDIESLAARLQRARRITAITGAGVSAASGVPTFRGKDGLWRTWRAEELATPEAFARDPRLVWEWYDWRRSLIARCRPNPAHQTLARLSGHPGFTLITQNVDGLHERAGSRDVVQYHGSIWHLRCAAGCGGKRRWEELSTPLSVLPPRCGRCGGLARPDVVWFGEPIDAGVLARCDAAASCDVFLSIGTSSVVYPAASLVHEARARGAFAAEINPTASASAALVDVAIAHPAEEVLPLLFPIEPHRLPV